MKSLLVHITYIYLRTTSNISTNVGSRYSKVSMRYMVQMITAPPGGNNGVSVYISKAMTEAKICLEQKLEIFIKNGFAEPPVEREIFKTN